MDIFWLCYGEYKGKRTVFLFNQYLQAKFRTHKNEVLHDIFVTDAVKNINDSIAETFGGAVMKKRYADMIFPALAEERTAEEIISDISEKLNNIGAE